MSDLQEDVKQKYRDAAKRAASGGTACCGGGAERSGCDPISKDLYTNAEKGALPEKALAASLGGAVVACNTPASTTSPTVAAPPSTEASTPASSTESSPAASEAPSAAAPSGS